jgi:predicted RNA binding protein YcfA (HicA-like mRNA interferase family)
MTRLPTLSARKVIQALERGGFVATGQKGSHFFLEHPGKGLVTTVPKHNKDVNRSLMKLILKQAGLTEEEFRKLI